MSTSLAANKILMRATLTFFAVSLLSCIPSLWLLILTPMHDGSEIPSTAICLSASGMSLFLGGIAGLFVRYRTLTLPTSDDQDDE